MSVIVDDGAPALAYVVQGGAAPAAIAFLAGGVDAVTGIANVATRLHVIAAWIAVAVVVVAVWIAVSVVRSARAARQMAVDVYDLSTALVNVVQAGVPPSAVALLAACINVVAGLPNIAASLSVSAVARLPVVVASVIAVSVAIAVSIPITVLGIAVIVAISVTIATQVAIVIDDLVAAALDIA